MDLSNTDPMMNKSTPSKTPAASMPAEAANYHLDPGCIQNQATINIGCIGHVAHGKSRLIAALTGVKTGKHSKELKLNRTIVLGYANLKIYKCQVCEAYAPANSTVAKLLCKECLSKKPMTLVRHFSFVDCPGHEVFMQTMLNGAAVMDAALLVVAANEPCPQPQTKEHLAAIDLLGGKPMLVVQNKIDLIEPARALESYNEICAFIGVNPDEIATLGNLTTPTATPALGAAHPHPSPTDDQTAHTAATKTTGKQKGKGKGKPAVHAAALPAPAIVPLSAIHGHNVDVLCRYLVEKIPLPARDLTAPPMMIVVRSFDVNKPGAGYDSLLGGVCGGSLLRGQMSVGDEIEIRPGLISRGSDGLCTATPIRTTIESLFSESNELDRVVPGGLIAVGSRLDPSLTRGNRMVGHVIGFPGLMPPIYDIIEVSYILLRRFVGLNDKANPASAVKNEDRIKKLEKGEKVRLNINSLSTNAVVLDTKADLLRLQLATPVCMELKQRIAINRIVNRHFRLIGYGMLMKCKPMLE